MTQQHRTTLTLYRDCLRAARHFAARTPKEQRIRSMIRSEFERNRDVISFDEVKHLREQAITGLQNYVFMYNMIKANPKGLKLRDGGAENSPAPVAKGMNPLSGLMSTKELLKSQLGPSDKERMRATLEKAMAIPDFEDSKQK